MSLTVRPSRAAGHLAFVQTQWSVSFLQTPGTGSRQDQLWRRNINKAAKAGVQVTVGEDLKAFHDLYVHTAERDPLQALATALRATGYPSAFRRHIEIHIRAGNIRSS